MFNKKNKVDDSLIDLPEDTPISQGMDLNDEENFEEVEYPTEESEQQESSEEKTEKPKEEVKEFTSVIAAEVLSDELIKYTVLSNRIFKLGIQED